MQQLAKVLKSLRNEEGLTQDALAADLGVTRFMISYYENGREPSLDILALYAKRFNTSVDYLLGLTTEKHRPESDSEVMLGRLAQLVSSSGGKPLLADDFTNLLKALHQYYRSGSLAGHAPLDAVRQFVNAMTALLDSLRKDDAAATLMAINDASSVALTINQILVEYMAYRNR